jgi:Protein involved in meta-pathway of phenol degradation
VRQRSGDRVGCFESRVVGIGPQIGYLFPIGTMQGYLNFKAYAEFDAAARPSGWNAWVTFVLSPGRAHSNRGAAANDYEIASR